MACRFALVIYRDHCDGPNRFQIFNFMAAEELQVLLGTVVAEGGGDGPEDCFGGLHKAATAVKWQAPARVCLWMGDAPQALHHRRLRPHHQVHRWHDRRAAEGRSISGFGDLAVQRWRRHGAVPGRLSDGHGVPDECSTKAGAPRPREPKDHVIIPVAWRSGFEYWGETEAGRMTSVRAYMGLIFWR